MCLPRQPISVEDSIAQALLPRLGVPDLAVYGTLLRAVSDLDLLHHVSTVLPNNCFQHSVRPSCRGATKGVQHQCNVRRRYETHLVLVDDLVWEIADWKAVDKKFNFLAGGIVPGARNWLDRDRILRFIIGVRKEELTKIFDCFAKITRYGCRSTRCKTGGHIGWLPPGQFQRHTRNCPKQ